MKKETLIEGTKFARKCDATGEGMNVGFCVGEGEQYFKHSADLIKFLRGKDYETAEGEKVNEKFKDDDEALKEWAFNDEIYYHTEWEMPADAQYIVKGGKLVEIEEEEQEETESGKSLIEALEEYEGTDFVVNDALIEFIKEKGGK